MEFLMRILLLLINFKEAHTNSKTIIPALGENIQILMPIQSLTKIPSMP